MTKRNKNGNETGMPVLEVLLGQVFDAFYQYSFYRYFKFLLNFHSVDLILIKYYQPTTGVNRQEQAPSGASVRTIFFVNFLAVLILAKKGSRPEIFSIIFLSGQIERHMFSFLPHLGVWNANMLQRYNHEFL